MRRKRMLKHVVLIVMMSMTLGLGNIASAQAPEDDVFAVIKVSNPEALLPAIGGLVEKFQPGMGGMINPMMVGQMAFNNPNWTGMNMSGEYTVVVLDPMKYSPNPIGIIVPLTAKDEYLAALSESLTGGEEADGVYNFMQPNQKSLFVAPTDNAGVLAESTEIATLVKSLVDAGSPVLSEAVAVKGQVVASVAFSKVMTAMQPMVDMMKQQALMAMQAEMETAEEDDAAAEGEEEGEAEGDDAAAQTAAVAEIAEAEIDFVLSLFQQTEKLQLGLSLEDAGLRLSKAVFAAADSELATFMAAQSPKKSDLLKLVPADSALLFSGSMELTADFQKGYLDFFKTVVGLDKEIDDETVAMLTGLVENAFAAFGGDFAAGMLSPTSDTLVTEVISLKDAALAKEVVAQYPKMVESMMGVYEEMGVDFKMSLADTAEVKGGEVMQYQFDFNADMIPDPEGQEAFKAIFGESLELPIGFAGNYAVIGFGKDAMTQVSQVMENLDAGAEAAAQFTPAGFGLPEENNFYMYLSVPKVLAWAATKNLPDVPSFEAVESPGLGMSARFVETRLEGELFLPVEELLAIKQITEQAQSQAAPAGEEFGEESLDEGAEEEPVDEELEEEPVEE